VGGLPLEGFGIYNMYMCNTKFLKMFETDMEGGGLLHEHTKSIQTIAPGLTIHKVGGLRLKGFGIYNMYMSYAKFLKNL
jgi:hypothetical protein